VDAAFGILAALCTVAGTVPYVRDTLRGTTHPHRATWFIWSTLALVALASQRAEGASWSLALVGAQFGGCVVMLVLSAPSVRRALGQE